MLMRTRLPAAVFCSFLLVSAWVEPVLGAENKVLSVADGDFLGGFVTDGGRVVVAVEPSPELEEIRSTLVSWSGGESHTEEIDFLVKRLRAAPEGRFLVWGYRRQDDDHLWGLRVYRVAPSGFKLEREFDLDREWTGAAWAWASHDLTVWVGMRDLYPPRTKRWQAKALGREFAVGSMKTGKVRRKIGVELFPASPLEQDYVAFVILDSDGPTVLASYSTRLFLHRFSDGGVESRPIDHLREVVHPRGGDLAVVWQEGDQVLWARSGDEWQAYDLWNLAYTFDVPREPFLRRKAASGRPHPTRGFVGIQEDGDGGFRVRHFWQSPQFPDWKEEHFSGWQRGKKPLEPIVSPNGRHFLAVESRRSEDGTFSMNARRVELTPAPQPLRQEAARQEHGEAQGPPKSADG
jgi:hypothetical protein